MAERQSSFAVRKLDLEDPWWNVVDLRVPRAAILAPAAIVYRSQSYDDARKAAKRFNEEETGS